jgi:tetratricopeptide (TPR) repeat protein
MAARFSRLAPTVTILLSMMVASEAGAQEPSRELAQRAMSHYERGVSAYRNARYDEAIEAFNRAYAVDPAPILVFNIAQAYWKKSDRQPALEAYRRYLILDPSAPNRAQVETRIQELTGTAPALAPSPVEPAPLPAPAPPRPVPGALALAPAPPSAPVLTASRPAGEAAERAFYRRGLFWSVVGAVVVGTGVAVALAARSGGDRWSCVDCNWQGARVR